MYVCFPVLRHSQQPNMSLYNLYTLNRVYIIYIYIIYMCKFMHRHPRRIPVNQIHQTTYRLLTRWLHSFVLQKTQMHHPLPGDSSRDSFKRDGYGDLLRFFTGLSDLQLGDGMKRYEKVTA